MSYNFKTNWKSDDYINSDDLNRIANNIENLIIEINEKIKKTTFPIGTIRWHGEDIPPNDWLVLDGSHFDSKEYIELYNLLGTTILPDLMSNNLFIRSASSIAEVGLEILDDKVLNHQHDISQGVFPHSHTYAMYRGGARVSIKADFLLPVVGIRDFIYRNMVTSFAGDHSHLITPVGSVENRPKNIKLLPIIKAK